MNMLSSKMFFLVKYVGLFTFSMEHSAIQIRFDIHRETKTYFLHTKYQCLHKMCLWSTSICFCRSYCCCFFHSFCSLYLFINETMRPKMYATSQRAKDDNKRK